MRESVSVTLTGGMEKKKNRKTRGGRGTRPETWKRKMVVYLRLPLWSSSTTILPSATIPDGAVRALAVEVVVGRRGGKGGRWRRVGSVEVGVRRRCLRGTLLARGKLVGLGR